MAPERIPWKRMRRIAQAVFFIAWIVLWLIAAASETPARVIHLFAHLDPLLILARTVAGRALLTGFLLCLITIALTLLLGRAWCGWICPVGAVLDVFPFRRHPLHKAAVPERLRLGKYLLLWVIFIAALFGNLTLLIVDPMTLWVRTLTGGAAPSLNIAFTASERFLSNIPWMNSALMWLDGFMRPALFPLTPIGVRFVLLTVFIFTAVVLLNLAAERFWCRYLCPLGGLLGILSRFALFKRKVNDGCISCAKCVKVCPTGTIDPLKDYASDAAECTMCMDCISSCPEKVISMKAGFSLPEKYPYDADRRALLAAGIITLSGLAVLESDSSSNKPPAFLIRPPGANDEDLLDTCIRCGLCIRSCPTGALQASVTESGLSGLFTPVLIPRLGYCLYSCNRCGEVCPVGAIPLLHLSEKQQQVIGHAYIDQNRCIPWTDHSTCIVCEEMCPLPEKAIYLEEREIEQRDGSTITVQLPHVSYDLCIGCGICEYMCPRGGEAAIRVHRLDVL